MAIRAGVQSILEPRSASVMTKTSFVEKINLFLFAISFSHDDEVIFHKDTVLWEKNTAEIVQQQIPGKLHCTVH